VTIPAVSLAENKEIPEALTQLNVSYPKPVIVLVGGAGGLGWRDILPMWRAVRIVARLAEEIDAAVIDGGTQAGIMTEIGQQRKRHKFSFPLIGVVFDGLLTQEKPQDVLDPNHTHFLLIPGDHWGDESAWISKIATVLAGDQKSITVLVNGGNISRTDVEYSLRENRPTFVMRGTGRMADEITLQNKIIPIDVSKRTDNILKFLKERLT
jgi:hypothetical protein